MIRKKKTKRKESKPSVCPDVKNRPMSKQNFDRNQHEKDVHKTGKEAQKKLNDITRIFQF